MKINETNKLMTENVSFTTARFLNWKEKKSNDGKQTYGQAEIQVGSETCKFTIFPPKPPAGATAGPLVRPAWAKEFGQPVILVGYGPSVENGYLRHNFDSIEILEK